MSCWAVTDRGDIFVHEPQSSQDANNGQASNM